MKIKNILFLIIVIMFAGLILASPVYGLEIKNYPSIPLPGVPNIDPANPSIPQFVAYVFGIGLYMVGLIALVFFSIGAVQFIASMDSVDLKSDAVSRMKSAGLGLVLVMISVLILQTINTSLVNPVLTPLGPLEGVYLFNNKDFINVSREVSDTSTIRSGYKELAYVCQSGTGPNIIIWKFPQKNLEQGNDPGDTNIKVVIKSCGQAEPITGFGSFKWEFETSGIYYCLGKCNDQKTCGYMSGPHISSQDYIEGAFAGKMKAMRVVTNYPFKETIYGIIFHKNQGLSKGGECTEPKTFDGLIHETCVDIEEENIPLTMAADIFEVNKEAYNSGTGVNFYSADSGWNARKESGIYEINSSKIDYKKSVDPDKLCYDYSGTNVAEAYKKRCSNSKCTNSCPAGQCMSSSGSCSTCSPGQTPANSNENCSPDFACETVKDCPGSLQINTHYLVGIYSQKMVGSSGNEVPSGPKYCITFKNNVENLKSKQIVPAGDKDIDGIYIIPTK